MHARFASPPLFLFALALLAVGCSPGQTDGSAAASRVEAAEPAPRALAAASAHEGIGAAASDEPVIHIYKTPTCGCCGDWVTHVEDAGFETAVQDLPNLAAVKQRLGVPHDLGSCHTSLVGDYVVEGHVPAEVIRRLLRERPDIAGIAVAGMPMGSPGMEGPWKDPYDVIAFRRDGGQVVFQSMR